MAQHDVWHPEDREPVNVRAEWARLIVQWGLKSAYRVEGTGDFSNLLEAIDEADARAN